MAYTPAAAVVEELHLQEEEAHFNQLP